MDDDNYVGWDCPECGETHEDPQGLDTHCRNCGLVVVAYDDPINMGWYVEPERGNYLAKQEKAGAK